MIFDVSFPPLLLFHENNDALYNYIMKIKKKFKNTYPLSQLNLGWVYAKALLRVIHKSPFRLVFLLAVWAAVRFPPFSYARIWLCLCAVLRVTSQSPFRPEYLRAVRAVVGCLSRVLEQVFLQDLPPAEALLAHVAHMRLHVRVAL